MLAHESTKLSESKMTITKTSGPFFKINRLNGFNNLGRISWRSLKYSTSWFSISISLVLCFCIILDSSTVAGYPASSSRSYRDVKNIPSTSTLHSLQGVDSGSSLSIVSPLDILRQNMVMEIMRRRIRHAKQRQLQSNKEILDRIG